MMLDTKQSEASTPNKLRRASTLINPEGIELSWYDMHSRRTRQFGESMTNMNACVAIVFV